MDRRIRELEEENQKLRAELDETTQALEWHQSLGLPLTEAEMLERARTGPTISDVIAECEREFESDRR